MARRVKLFRNFHIVISGFLQHEGKPNGMIRLWRLLHEDQCGKDTIVLLRTWNDNMDTLAEFINRVSGGDEVIKIYAYSWGGAAAVRLSKALRTRNMSVRAMVLSDAVYRHPYWLGNWRAFVSSIPLVIPGNVKFVRWFRQKSPYYEISGHDVIREEGSSTNTLGSEVSYVSHKFMDDLQAFRNASLLAAAGIYEGKGRK